jgi:hypothetical protein
MEPHIAQVDLDSVDTQQELVVRAGTVRPPDLSVDVVQILIGNYGAIDENYPGIFGFSVLYHQGMQLDDLALRNPVPHKKLSYGTVILLQQESRKVGYEMVLFITPNADLPDHHSLAVQRAGNAAPEQEMPRAIAEMLVRVSTVDDNPHPKRK